MKVTGTKCRILKYRQELAGEESTTAHTKKKKKKKGRIYQGRNKVLATLLSD